MLPICLLHYVLIFSAGNALTPASAQFLRNLPDFLVPSFNGISRKHLKNDVQQRSSYGSDYQAGRALRYIGENNVICEVSITKEVFSEEGYEFFPSEYVNKTCISTNSDPFVTHSNEILKPEICLHNDNQFGCQTLYEDLYVLKKSTRGRKECWEHTSQIVAVGCKCNIRFNYN